MVCPHWALAHSDALAHTIRICSVCCLNLFLLLPTKIFMLRAIHKAKYRKLLCQSYLCLSVRPLFSGSNASLSKLLKENTLAMVYWYKCTLFRSVHNNPYICDCYIQYLTNWVKEKLLPLSLWADKSRCYDTRVPLVELSDDFFGHCKGRYNRRLHLELEYSREAVPINCNFLIRTNLYF